MSSNASVTGRGTRCAICGQRFRARRADARYCSPACRQAAYRRREDDESKLVLEIDAARRHYYKLLTKLAATLGMDTGWINTNLLAQWVDEDGYVYMRGQLVGKAPSTTAGWTTWGLEAAGPPWSPPQASYEPTERERAEARKARDRAERTRNAPVTPQKAKKGRRERS